jgi:hypothetical protein
VTVEYRICTRCGELKSLDEMSARNERKNARGHCKACQKAYLKEYHAKYRLLPGMKEKQKQVVADWRKAQSPEYHRDLNLKKKYGISLDDYEMMLVRQDGACAICGSWDPSTRYSVFCVDHCHGTGQVRSLLCSKCNWAIGMLDENPDLFDAAKAYIMKHEETEVRKDG